MIYVGRKNRMRVVKAVDFGLYLDGGDAGEILLPRREAPSDCKPGDFLHVFVYRDSEDRLIATRETPKAMVGECALLKVKQQNDVGTFMDWGLSKDLLVPFSEQAWPMNPGRSYVVCLFLDQQTDRVAASTKYSRHLNEDGSGFRPGEKVKLMIASRTELGYKAVINNTHLGLMFKTDVFQPLKFGQQLRGYIKAIRADGKIDLTLQPAPDEARDQLEDQILDYLHRHGGVSKITDKSPPELIYKTFKTSKTNFKRALGRLYRKHRVSIEKYRISLVED
jgi:predicted RNA-binding protein (virulence factor B family)